MQSEKISSAQLRADLSLHTGSEQLYRHALQKNCLYTEGVQYFAENAGCYWFLDILATEVFMLQARSEFLAIELNVADGKAVILVTDGNGQKLWSRRIPFTDAPSGVWSFYLSNSVCLLPSEY
jgi:hypothetical protein